MLVRRAHGDDAIRAGHLLLEVGVVGDGHELGIAWSPQNGMVGPTEPDNLEGEGFPPKIRRSPEADWQIDLSERGGTLSWHDTMEWSYVSSQPRPTDPHEVKSLDV
jgi:hypothetical protein